eukprot:365954-Chlamydomonas_euryale.AAC.6
MSTPHVQGRLLIRAEQDAVARGAALGDALSTSARELGFSAAAVGRRPTEHPGRVRGVWGSLFGRGTLAPAAAA